MSVIYQKRNFKGKWIKSPNENRQITIENVSLYIKQVSLQKIIWNVLCECLGDS